MLPTKNIQKHIINSLLSYKTTLNPSNFTKNIFALNWNLTWEQNRTVLYLNDDWTETIALIFGDGYIYTKWFATQKKST